MEVHIMRGTLRYVDDAARLFDEYRQFYGMPSDFQGAREFLTARLQKKDSVILMAVGGQRRPLGFVQLYPMFSSTRMQKLWILNDLFVLPGVRRQGIGRQLMEAAHSHAVQRDVRILVLATGKDNTQAKRLYKSLGYELDTAFDHYELSL